MSQKTRLTVHHRRCKSNGGRNQPENLVYVDQLKHRAWHILFGNMKIDQIAYVLNNTWIDPRFKLIVQESEE